MQSKLPPTVHRAFRKAIEIAGSETQLARKLRFRGKSPTRSALAMWAFAGRIPAQWALEIERVTGVPVEKLAPDYRWSVLLKRQPKMAEKITTAKV